MSKIGRVALEAQEEVLNPLGYSTVDEAIADGWDSAEWLAARESEQEKAHEAWLKERRVILNQLKTVQDLVNHWATYTDSIGKTLDKAIKFIEGVSHE